MHIHALHTTPDPCSTRSKTSREKGTRKNNWISSKIKVYEPLLIVGADKFAGVDIRIRVSGGGQTSQVYAIRQAIAKSIVAYYQKFVDEHSKNQIKQAFAQYDRTLLVADNRRPEPKKFGGRGARARYQKSYR